MAFISDLPIPENSEKRLHILQFIFILIIVLFAMRLFFMQILSGERYLQQAQDIARLTTVIPAQRGEIFDQSFTDPLVMNVDSFAVSIIPAEVPRGEISDVLNAVAEITGISLKELEEKIPPQNYYLYQPVELAVNVPFQIIASLAERKDTLPGISWQAKPVRSYADVGSLAHIIGYVGNITRDELTLMYNRGYKQGDVIGKVGIERQYDEILRGSDGFESRTVDVRLRRIDNEAGSQRTPPEMGKNLVLTIDRRIQLLTEKALGERIGAAVVLRPSTGEILAMVSYPWYDPNLFNSSGMAASYQALINDPNKPFLNRAIQSSYAPGSTFKIIMTTGLLAESAIPPLQTVECQGILNYGNREWHCHIGKPGHGRLNLQYALAQSCDIYYWTVGRDYLGAERIVRYAGEYGLGGLTGIDIPGEVTGFLPDPQWKKRRFHEDWLLGDTMNMSIGQGWTLVTPLQMANLAAMTVNDGVIYRPHLLKEIRDPLSGRVETGITPEILHTAADIDPEVFKTVRRDMRTVISAGTAQYPLNRGVVEIAGKTGTSEVGFQNRWHSWFTAFAPYETENPEERIVVSVIVEATNNWEWWAPYASAIIFQGVFASQTFEEAVAKLGFQYLMPVTGRRE